MLRGKYTSSLTRVYYVILKLLRPKRGKENNSRKPEIAAKEYSGSGDCV